MIRKQAATPSAEDISRHEEEVAAFLSRYRLGGEPMPAGLSLMDQLHLILGRYHAMFANPRQPDRERLTRDIIHLTAVVLRQRCIDQHH